MRIKFLSEGVGTGLEGVEARVGDVIDHPLAWAAKMLIARGHAEETAETPTTPSDTDYEAPSGRLTDVDGIGQVTAAQLARGGILTLRDLADAAVSAVTKAAGGKSEKHVQRWIAEARQLLGLPAAAAQETAHGAAKSPEPDAG